MGSQITVSASAGRRLSTKDGCKSSDVTAKLTSCMQGFTAALAGGDVCGSWGTFECCMTKEFASCDEATKKSVADKVVMQKSTYEKINSNLKSCTAQCATTSTSGPKDMDVTITIDGSMDPVAAATKAKAVKSSAGTDTAAALKTALGGDVTIKTQPVAKAKVETKVKAEASKSAQIKSAISSSAV